MPLSYGASTHSSLHTQVKLPSDIRAEGEALDGTAVTGKTRWDTVGDSRKGLPDPMTFRLHCLETMSYANKGVGALLLHG